MQLELSDNSSCFESKHHACMGLSAGRHSPQAELSAKTGNG